MAETIARDADKEQVIVAPRVRDADELAGDLVGWLKTRLPGDAEVRVRNVRYPFGAGQSHETILFDAEWLEDGERRDHGLVVRIKPTDHTVYADDLFEEQYRIMLAMHDHGAVRVARPLWYEADAAVLGSPFFVMEKKDGRVAVSVPPYARTGWVADATPEERRRIWENGVRQLAAIQTVPRDGLDFLKGPDHAPEGLEQEWDKYVRFVDWLEEERPWPVLREALESLRARWPKNQPAGIVWGDARLGNMMFGADGEVVAVMDWEQPSLGGALHDLAWWTSLATLQESFSETGDLLGMGSRDETLALWRSVTGISTDDFEWYEDFTQLKLSCLGVRTAKLKNWPTPTDADMRKRLKLPQPA